MRILQGAVESTAGGGWGGRGSIGRRHLSLVMCLVELWVSFGQMIKPSLIVSKS